jgi:hypothetical protein
MSKAVAIKEKIEAPETVSLFANVYSAVHGVDLNKAEQMYKVEAHQYQKLLYESQALVNVNYTIMSARGVFIDVVSAGLSFNPLMKQVYVMSRSVKTGKKTDGGKDIYEDRLYFTPQADGLIHLARQAGSIKDITEPVVVYEDDVFRAGTDKDGRDWIEYEEGPGASNKIIGAFCYVVATDGTRYPVRMNLREIDRLKEYSSKQNSKWDDSIRKKVPGAPNALYTSNGGQIDPGFLRTKLVKKALRYKDKKEVKGLTYVEDIDPIPAPGADLSEPEFTEAEITTADEGTSTSPVTAPASTTNDDDPF